MSAQGLSLNAEIMSEAGSELTRLVLTGDYRKLSDEIQNRTIESLETLKQLESGQIGKILGTRLPNMAIYGSFVLSMFFALLILICVCALMCEKLSVEFVLEGMKLTIPVITMSLGYMFGKKDSPDH